ncbi:hypothetical protein BST28_22990, partial [Mycolicibacter kumamotonensis]
MRSGAFAVDEIECTVGDTGMGRSDLLRIADVGLAHFEGVSFHLCKSEVVHHRTAVGADRRSV